MNFINYVFLFVVLSISATSHSESASANQQKSPLQICAEKKLKDFRVRNLVSVSEEPTYIEKFKQVCAKEQIAANSDKQAADAAARAEKDKKIVAVPAKPASADQTKAAVPPKPAPAPNAPAAGSGGSSSGQVVFGGCGSPEQCAAHMAESKREKFVWSSPGLQAYLGELWGNNLNGYSFGDQFEQPDSPCGDKNQGEIIALDLGTELRPIACMSNQSTQEEIKKMAEKIKNVKVDTLPVVVAVKKAKYKWITLEEPPPLAENEIRFCAPVSDAACWTNNIGEIERSQPRCGVYKCVRIDGGPVKTVKKEEKKENPIVRAAPELPVEAIRDPAQANPIYQGFDTDRDGAGQ